MEEQKLDCRRERRGVGALLSRKMSSPIQIIQIKAYYLFQLSLCIVGPILNALKCFTKWLSRLKSRLPLETLKHKRDSQYRRLTTNKAIFKTFLATGRFAVQ